MAGTHSCPTTTTGYTGGEYGRKVKNLCKLVKLLAEKSFRVIKARHGIAELFITSCVSLVLSHSSFSTLYTIYIWTFYYIILYV